jgi:hypothetical protein
MVEQKTFSKTKALSMVSTKRTKTLMNSRDSFIVTLKRDRQICKDTTKNVKLPLNRHKKLKISSRRKKLKDMKCKLKDKLKKRS